MHGTRRRAHIEVRPNVCTGHFRLLCPTVRAAASPRRCGRRRVDVRVRELVEGSRVSAAYPSTARTVGNFRLGYITCPAYLTLTLPAMSTTGDDYDSLSKEEREARDKADREREEKEQAGMTSQRFNHVVLIVPSITVLLEAAVSGCRYRDSDSQRHTRKAAKCYYTEEEAERRAQGSGAHHVRGTLQGH